MLRMRFDFASVSFSLTWFAQPANSLRVSQLPSLIPQSTSSRVIVSGKHREREQAWIRASLATFSPLLDQTAARSGCSLIRRALIALMWLKNRSSASGVCGTFFGCGC